jgi:hypothetical protein
MLVQTRARVEGCSLVVASRGLDLEESSGLHLLGGDQAHVSSGFKWQKRVELNVSGTLDLRLGDPCL